MQYTIAATGLTATLAGDLWGASHHLMFYLRPPTLRETANGYAILTRRADGCSGSSRSSPASTGSVSKRGRGTGGSR
ncbi:cholesterol oxidase substrate-binding domain-containing protein [Streptomyces sp. 8K308]|uniref:cholesterol oxidase substrate-binding domain-containing protein n=1 Tax=Streptomyces sp. 8K308 TaxID=2530388 RepID=UPI0032634DF6